MSVPPNIQKVLEHELFTSLSEDRLSIDSETSKSSGSGTCGRRRLKVHNMVVVLCVQTCPIPLNNYEAAFHFQALTTPYAADVLSLMQGFSSGKFQPLGLCVVDTVGTDGCGGGTGPYVVNMVVAVVILGLMLSTWWLRWWYWAWYCQQCGCGGGTGPDIVNMMVAVVVLGLMLSTWWLRWWYWA